jgi:hypothetical protein
VTSLVKVPVGEDGNGGGTDDFVELPIVPPHHIDPSPPASSRGPLLTSAREKFAIVTGGLAAAIIVVLALLLRMRHSNLTKAKKMKEDLLMVDVEEGSQGSSKSSRSYRYVTKVGSTYKSRRFFEVLPLQDNSDVPIENWNAKRITMPTASSVTGDDTYSFYGLTTDDSSVYPIQPPNSLANSPSVRSTTTSGEQPRSPDRLYQPVLSPGRKKVFDHRRVKTYG